jgi:hypothetical protein
MTRPWPPDSDMTTPAPDLERQLALVFLPLDKRAMGFGFGAAFVFLLASATVMSMLLDPEQRLPIGLLRAYFYGYSPTVLGLFIGSAWAFAAGFFWGWFTAFARNLVYAIWLMTLRIRTDFSTSRDFLDHV